MAVITTPTFPNPQLPRDPIRPPAPSSALVGQEAFDAHWQTVNGYIQISNGKWTNNASVPVQSSTLECDQYDSGGSDLAQMKTTLNGPVQAGSYATFSPFQMGAVTVNVNRVSVHHRGRHSNQLTLSFGNRNFVAFLRPGYLPGPLRFRLTPPA